MSTDPQEVSPRSLIARDFIRATRAKIYNNTLSGAGFGTAAGAGIGMALQILKYMGTAFTDKHYDKALPIDYSVPINFAIVGLVIGTAYGLMDGADKRDRILTNGLTRYINHVAPLPSKAEAVPPPELDGPA